MRKNLCRALALSCLSIISSCHVSDLDKVKPATISPHLAINLGFTEYTVRELLEDLDGVSVDEDLTNQTLSLIFEDSTVFNNNEELVSINSVSNEEEFAPGEDQSSTAPGYDIEIMETFTFSFPANNGEQIDSIYYSSGTFDFEMISTFDGDIDYTWVVQGTQDVDTEENLTRTNQLEYTGSDVTDTYSRPLLGLKSKFDKVGDENQFQVVVTGTITFDEGSVVLPTDRMEFNLGYNNPGISKLYGDFGSETINLQSQSVDMGSFEDFSGDGLKLEDPKVLLITENSYGLDLEMIFDEVKAIGSDNSELLLTERGSGIDGFVGSPEVEGNTLTDTVTINAQNSNIDDLLNSTPVTMDFTISATPNPAESERETNFLLEDSQIKVRSLIVIPMQFRMNGFSVDFDFDIGGSDIEDAESLSFNIITTNTLPLNGSIDLNFLDVDGNTIYTLTDAASFESPNVNSEGRTTEAQITNSGIELTQEGIDAFINADRIAAIANISTFEAEEDRFVTLYSDYTLKIEMSVAGEVTVEL